MFYQVFLSPQVKQWAMISYKHGMYEMPHKLLNFSRFGLFHIKARVSLKYFVSYFSQSFQSFRQNTWFIGTNRGLT